MTISGFSFVRNAIKLYYPVVESIRSILPLVDEFVIACGDSVDDTTEAIRTIHDPKVKIIETVWNKNQFVKGASNAVQTNIALNACTGDWCFYVQADEVVHERYLPVLKEKMERYLDVPAVEGFLFDYRHFYASYDLYQTGHNWYDHEVRIIRNGIGILSWKDAQGFRKRGKKLKVVPADAEIYHYGWVRPPQKMTKKQIALASVYCTDEWVRNKYPDCEVEYNFGSLKTCRRFTGIHPKVMDERIKSLNWIVGPGKPNKKYLKHDRLWVRALTWVELNILHDKVGEYRNYTLINDPLR